MDGENLDVGILFKGNEKILSTSREIRMYLPMVTNSAKRSIACFDVQYSLVFGIRNWAALELTVTNLALCFSNRKALEYRMRMGHDSEHTILPHWI